MQREIDRLNKRVGQLENELKNVTSRAQTAGPINLGRTSLAAVNASSVNGRSNLADQYYGVTNAFDGGQNWINNINYTYWLGSGEPAPWIEVVFDVPVAITSINVDGGPAFSTQLFFAAGGEEDYPEKSGQLTLEKPLQGISKVRLNLKGGRGNPQVDEIRVLGYVPPQVKYESRSPRVLLTPQNALAIARSKFQEWQTNLLAVSPSEAIEQGDEYSIVFKTIAPDYDVYRVIINKKTGVVSAEGLVGLTPLK